ncbi:MAG: hypothetical protein U0802_02070 [Candidatus Binatia bacterium]
MTPIRPMASATADFADSTDAVDTAAILPVNAAVTTDAYQHQPHRVHHRRPLLTTDGRQSARLARPG